ncbi:hypothetical protein AR457_32895 [Streptomyces agglomeratus]|uniref:Tat pathway signal sequence domain protein n=1 Tax=Streptomyces agglomeratus TaxID=285458 RepID=A0A1E5PGA4_9ACTN|nr:hypothetical protein [Streptomyces agglomeratus]OEJ28551.1 hypothetical protein AS594_32810 [Streptomyces agglomeratus]OEJ37386.1 hypothetical protein BGK70_03765 [Streptomyces agglomeratus]OEJ48230.1 hypothetical protein AR457_32895 [Streptomyces agglomeratus]OEJ49927.1 hypothetical protein BGK72_03255 [Streptomyces agglomeratus]OEJ57254.1 hypothetical protein BGM19_03945 [Streptomyces agglomeratus]
MAIAHALRAAVVTVALAGAALLGTQAALADDAAPAGGVTGTSSPQEATPTPAPSPTSDNNPWD